MGWLSSGVGVRSATGRAWRGDSERAVMLVVQLLVVVVVISQWELSKLGALTFMSLFSTPWDDVRFVDDGSWGEGLICPDKTHD